MRKGLIVAILGGLLGSVMAAQTRGQPAAPQTLPQFEVASVKLNKSAQKMMGMRVQGDRFTATNISLEMLIRNAYTLQDDSQIVGGPDWVSSERYDVIAKAEDDGTGNPLRPENPGEPSRGQLMLRALLADRFKLVTHDEHREMPIYALVLARSDGKLGPHLHKSSADCAGFLGGGRGRGQGPDTAVGAPPAIDLNACGARLGPGDMIVNGSTMARFAGALGMAAGRLVVDKTGLTGAYDVTLAWTPDFMAQRPPDAPPAMSGGAPIDPNGPSIFAALQEQLGLKLDSQKGQVSVLVIDRAEHPIED